MLQTTHSIVPTEKSLGNIQNKSVIEILIFQGVFLNKVAKACLLGTMNGLKRNYTNIMLDTVQCLRHFKSWLYSHLQIAIILPLKKTTF
jgi:hypothetical protein